MSSLFPLDAGMSHVRGIVEIARENGGKISISKLAEESEEDVDDLLPLLNACRMLGFITIRRSEVKLTQKGERLVGSAVRPIIRESISKIEPFKSAIAALSEGSKTTAELLEYLRARGAFPEEGEHSGDKLLKLLLAWGVRSKLMSYDEENETWILVS